MRKLFFCALTLLVCPALMAQTTYYLRADGTAANKAAATGAVCASAAAAMTIATHDADTYTAGDTIVVCDDGGTFRDQLDVPSGGSAAAQITYQVETGGAPVISGADILTTFTASFVTDVYGANGGFETAGGGGADVFANWTEDTAGASTVNDEGVDVVEGSHACRIDIDVGSNTGRVFRLDTTLVASTVYQLSVWYKTTAGGTVQFTMKDDTSGDWLTPAGLWAGWQVYEGDAEAAWSNTLRTFTAPSSGTYEMVFSDSGSASYSFFIDDITLRTQSTTTFQRGGTATEPQIVIYDDVVLTPNNGATIAVGANEWDWNANTLYVNVGEDPDIGTLEAGQRDHGITATAIDYITISGIEFQGTDNPAIENNGGDNWVVEDCTFRRTSVNQAGPNIYGTVAMLGAASVATIDGNTFVNTMGDCVYSDQYDDLVITDNTFTNCLGVSGDGIHLDDSDDYQVLRNTIGAVSVSHVKTEGGAGGEVAYNICTNGVEGGIGVRGTALDIHHNSVSDVSGEAWSFGIAVTALALTDAAGDIYTNIVDNANIGIYIIGGTANDRDFNIYNNIVYGENMAQGFQSDGTAEFYGEIQNNIIWAVTPTSYAFRVGNVMGGETLVSDYNLIGPEAVNYIYYADTAYSTLAAYSAAKAQDANSIAGNPVFINAADNDFHLQATSPAINAGTDVGLGGQLDYDGQAMPSYGRAVDIGAYEALYAKRYWNRRRSRRPR